MKFLIADDEPEIAELIAFFLKENCSTTIETFLVGSGLEAKKILMEHHIDVCISDHNMPEGNGNTILEFILNHKLNTSFVSCSTLAEQNMPEEYSRDHIFFIITKPRIINGLISLLELLQTKV